MGQLLSSLLLVVISLMPWDPYLLRTAQLCMLGLIGITGVEETSST